MPAAVHITEYTDPACPFAFSAEPHKRRLQWLYGDQLSFDVRMVGLAGSRRDHADTGLLDDPEAIATAGARRQAVGSDAYWTAA